MQTHTHLLWLMVAILQMAVSQCTACAGDGGLSTGCPEQSIGEQHQA